MKPGIDGTVSGDLWLRHLSLRVFFLLFTQQIFTEPLLCAMCWARCSGYSWEQDRHCPYPHGASSLVGETLCKQRNE